MQMEITFEDPGTFDSPLQAVIPMDYVADAELLETVCNEASAGGNPWDGRVTDAEEAAIDVDTEILARYEGRYSGRWGTRPITIEVILEDGALVMERFGAENDQRNGDQRLRLIPRSEAAFDCSCGWGYIFRTGDEGFATEVEEVHVSGAYILRRLP